MGTGWDLSELKKQIAIFHDRGTVSAEVVSAIVRDGLCAPVECEIFDYKESQASTAAAIAKLIRHIASFYNSFGGYLLFGVSEVESETRFEVVGIPSDLLNLESLKAKIREYLGERIQISGQLFSSKTPQGTACSLYLLFVPKRPDVGRPPVHFLKDGPDQVFKKDDVYHRSGDECIEAKGPRLFSLSQPRTNPYLTQSGGWSFDQFVTSRLQNNLPDRNIVCPSFVGRESYLDALWRWLGDDLSHVKMLAGEGGLGKSSIAYEFASRVSQIQNSPFEQIVWLTAKRKQFVGAQDDYISLPETHFGTYESLLRSIIEHLPIPVGQGELEEMGVDELRRDIKEALSSYPSFFVIDDVDSLEPEDQKRVVELGLMLGAVKSRLLITTRHNIAYSQELAIQISGFDESEFGEYLANLKDRGVLPRELKANERRRLYEKTQGSPLYTESVCRLLRFNQFDSALKDWGQNGGARARSAALDREISSLSSESKRVLLAAAYFVEASLPELSEASGYPQETVQLSIQELSSLFLLAEETLADQPRFSVPDNTVRLVVERSTALVVDHKRLSEKVVAIRSGAKAGKSKDQRVALAISQAQSLLRQNDLTAAVLTIDETMALIKNNPDLQGFRAELLMKMTPPQVDEARRIARDAFQKGCRRTSIYQVWFDAELKSGSFVGAAEAARAALENNASGSGDWWSNLAFSLANIAESHVIGMAMDRKVSNYFEASEAMANARKMARGSDVKTREGYQYDIHDRIWETLRRSLDSLDTVDIAVQALEKMWGLGDFRFSVANHASFLGHSICVLLESPLASRSARQVNAFESRFERCKRLIERRVTKYPDDTRHTALIEDLDRLSKRFTRVTLSQ